MQLDLHKVNAGAGFNNNLGGLRRCHWGS